MQSRTSLTIFHHQHLAPWRLHKPYSTIETWLPPKPVLLLNITVTTNNQRYINDNRYVSVARLSGFKQTMHRTEARLNYTVRFSCLCREHRCSRVMCRRMHALYPITLTRLVRRQKKHPVFKI